MGLDMYLNAKEYVRTDLTGLTFEVMYWRKANQIHQWFVNNVQDGVDDRKEYQVSRAQLQELLAVIQTVLTDPLKAKELLPTNTGFCFGSTLYNEDYYEDLTITRDRLTEILTHPAYENLGFVYLSSW